MKAANADYVQRRFDAAFSYPLHLGDEPMI